MLQQRLPNSTLILIFGILSIVICCCYGVGIIFSIIALVMAPKAIALYKEQPEAYTGYQNVTMGRILAIIGLILNLIFIAWMIYIFSAYSWEEIQQMNEEIMRQYGIE